MKRILVVAALGLALVSTLCAGFVVFNVLSVQRTWANLDDSANRLQRPTSFQEVARVRQGTALCVVTCTSGGEAIVTSVFDAGALTAGDACRELQQALDRLVGRLMAVETSYSCGWEGDLPRGAVAFGFVATPDQFKPLAPTGSFGPRWSDAVEVPPAALVAWVEFNSGLE